MKIVVLKIAKLQADAQTVFKRNVTKHTLSKPFRSFV